MKKKKNIFLVITVLLIGIGFLARLFLIWTSGESFHRVLALMLDDGYFGAGIARNFVNGHGVSFNAATAVFAATAFYYLGEKMSPKRYKHVMPLIAAGIFLFYSTLVFVQDGIAYRWVSGTPERLVLQGFAVRDQFPDDHNNWGDVLSAQSGILA